MFDPWNDARSYEPESANARVGGSSDFVLGVFVGAWFTVAAAFLVAFL